MSVSILDDLLSPTVSRREARPGIASVLPPDVEGTAYDTRAAAYDRVVGSALYNRLIWGVSTARYRTFVDRALADGSGPLLDAGAGSAVFTAEAYVQSDRPLILVDCSLGMLEAARNRLEKNAGGSMPDHVTLLHADVTDLPLRPEPIDTVLSMGMLHLFEDAGGHVDQLLRVLSPGGTLFATSLVTDRTVGRQYLRLLHRAGEVAAPLTYARLRQALASLNGAVEGKRDGNMAFFSIQTS